MGDILSYFRYRAMHLTPPATIFAQKVNVAFSGFQAVGQVHKWYLATVASTDR